MKRVILLSILCLPLLLNAQTSVKGIVTEQNSGNKPIPGVQLKALGTTPELSDNAGLFKMVFTTKKPGDRIIVSEISKKGYEIVNKDVVNNWVITNNINDKTKIVMCPEGLIAQNTLKFYDISLVGLTKGYESRIKSLQEQKDKAEIDAKSYAEQAKTLAEQFENQQKQLEELASKFAHENFDDCSLIHRQAFDAFKLGNIEKAIRILETVNSENEIAKAKKQRIKSENIINEEKMMLSQTDSIIKQNISKLMFQADLYANDFRFSDAEKTYEIAINADTSSFNIVFEYVKYLTIQNQYDKAIKWCNSTLSLAKTNSEQSKALNGLARLQYAMNLYDKAESNFTKALNIQTELVQANPDFYNADLYPILNNLALLQADMKQPDKAETNLNKALIVSKELLKSDSAEGNSGLAVTHKNLADLYSGMNQYDKALNEYFEAIHIFRELVKTKPQENNIFLATTLGNAGYLQIKMNLFDKAEINLNESLKLLRELAKYNPQMYNPNLSSSINGLAILYSHRSEYEKAESCYEEALIIQKELVKLNPLAFSFYLVRILNNMGTLQLMMSQYEKSKSFFMEALPICRELVKTNSQRYYPDLASTLFNLASSQSGMKQYKKAEANFIEALNIYKELAKTSPRDFNLDLAKTLFWLGQLYDEMNQKDKSIANYSEALILYRELATSNPQVRPNLAYILDDIAWTQYKADLTRSIDYASECINIYQQLADSVSTFKTNLAFECACMSRYQLLAKQYTEAERYARLALKNDNSLLGARKNLAHSYLFQGKYEEAKDIYMEIKDKEYPYDKTKKYKDVCLDDFDEFEKLGVTHPDVAKIKELLKQ